MATLKRADLEREVSALLEARTSLLKKHIACLKLHDQVRRAVEEANAKGDEEVQERYKSLLGQMDDEMASVEKKRKVKIRVLLHAMCNVLDFSNVRDGST